MLQRLCQCVQLAGPILATAMAATAHSGEEPGLPVEETVAHYGFEEGIPEGYETNENIASLAQGDLALDGKASLLVDTQGKEGEWFTYLTTPVGLLKANSRYWVGFDYQILDRDDDAHFLCYIQSPTERAKNRWGWKGYITWKGKPGERAVQTKKYVLPDYGDFRLYLGVHNGARIVIDNLTIQRLRSWDKQAVVKGAMPAASTRPWEPYGVCTHPGMPWVYTSDDQARTAMRMAGKAGFQWVRMGAGWTFAEPERGKINEKILNRLDVALDEARRHGVTAYFQFLGVPRWASAKPDDDQYWAYPPKKVDDWRNHVRYMAERYHDRVKSWEVWNEMDWTFWEPPLEDFVPLLKATYEELKRADPGCTVVLGGLATDGVHAWDNPRADTNALQRLYDAGAKPYFDVLSIHPYPSDVHVGVWESVDKVNTAYTIMERNGDGDKPIWITELGVSTFLNESSNFALTPDEQAQCLKDVFTILPLHPRVEKIFWYNFRCIGDDPKDQEHGFGVVNFDFSPRPGFHAMANLRKLSDRRVAPCLLEMDPLPVAAAVSKAEEERVESPAEHLK